MYLYYIELIMTIQERLSKTESQEPKEEKLDALLRERQSVTHELSQIDQKIRDCEETLKNV